MGNEERDPEILMAGFMAWPASWPI